MAKWLIVRQLAMSGEVDNIYVVEGDTEKEAYAQINDSGGFVSIIKNLDCTSLPLKVYRK
jgi:hypothetical protein